ncbi:MAG TPA: DUF1320 domain-containing protein [Azospirillum sp.]|nr:DUF1320 domain-containing protein [Azospirillum sp.]
MSYATLQDLIDRFGADELVQLTDRAAVPTEAIDEVVVGRALDDARRLIDGYVGGRYRLPLAPVPDLVRRIACDLARYFLHSNKPTELVKDSYKEAVRLLEKVAAGTVTLQAAGLEAPASTHTGAAFIAGEAPLFGRRAHRGS